MYIVTHTHAHTHTYIYIYIYLYIYVHKLTNKRTNKHVNRCIYIYIYTYGIYSSNIAIDVGWQILAHGKSFQFGTPTFRSYLVVASDPRFVINLDGCSNFTQGLQCSSFLVMTYFLLRDDNILPKTELHWSPWVAFLGPYSPDTGLRV